MLNRDLILIPLQLVLSAVYFAAGLPKLVNMKETVQAVRAYRLLPDSWSQLVAPWLVIFELALAVGLAVRLLLPFMFLMSTILLMVFSVAVGINIKRGLKIDCHCFGSGHSVISWRVLLRNAGLILLSVVGFLLSANGAYITPLDRVILLLCSITSSLAYHAIRTFLDIRVWLADNQVLYGRRGNLDFVAIPGSTLGVGEYSDATNNMVDTAERRRVGKPHASRHHPHS